MAGWEDHTPLAGAAMFLDSDGHKRRLDFLENVYGMNSDDIRTLRLPQMQERIRALRERQRERRSS